jgi:hypothetical protein
MPVSTLLSLSILQTSVIVPVLAQDISSITCDFLTVYPIWSLPFRTLARFSNPQKIEGGWGFVFRGGECEVKQTFGSSPDHDSFRRPMTGTAQHRICARLSGWRRRDTAGGWTQRDYFAIHLWCPIIIYGHTVVLCCWGAEATMLSASSENFPLRVH